MKKRRSLACDIILYIIATMMCLFVGYLFAAAIGGFENAPDLFWDRIFYVVNHMGVLFLNEYTVLFITLGFMLPQFIVGIMLFMKVMGHEETVSSCDERKTVSETVTKQILPDDLPTVYVDENESVSEIHETELYDLPNGSETIEVSDPQEDFRNNEIVNSEFELSENSDVRKEDRKEDRRDDLFSVFKRQNRDEEDVGFDQTTSLKMMNIGFNIDQIRAMMELKQYIGEVDASILCRLFNKDMSPAMIHEYIEAFYG